MRIAYAAPPHCSSCYAQQPEKQHVDFESSYDGPVIEGTIKVSIDEMIVCEDCMRLAASLLGFVDDEGAREELGALRQEVANLEDRLAERLAYTDQLERTIASKPKPPARKKAATK